MKRARPAAVAGYLETSRLVARARLRRRFVARDLSEVAVVADVSRANGLASGALLQHEALLARGVGSRLVDTGVGSRFSVRHVDHDPASTYVFHSGVPECSRLLHRVLPTAADAWRVGYWAWELPDPPPWQRYEALVHEVWTPSKFSASALRRILSVPVHVVGHRVPLSSRRRRDTSSPFTVLALADSRSSLERKNPWGAFEAFRRAFGEDGDARLRVKLTGGGEASDRMQRALEERANVEVVTARLDTEGMSALYRSADVLLSLHRSEGFGLPMLEAMAHGVPAVATGWSGNRDFMTEDDSMLVPYSLTPVRDPQGIYTLVSHWAEPEVDAAAGMLRELAFDHDLYEQMSLAAHNAVRDLPAAVPPEQVSS